MASELFIFWVSRKDTIKEGFTDFLVCTSTEEKARCVHPNGHCIFQNDIWMTDAYTMNLDPYYDLDWVEASKISSLNVKLMGSANPSNEEGIIWANYKTK